MIKHLQWRILIWHAVLLASVVCLFAATVFYLQRSATLRKIDDELAAAIQVLKSGLVSTQPIEIPKTFAPRRFHEPSEAPYHIIWRRDAGEIDASGHLDETPPRPDQNELSDSERMLFRNRGEFREAYATGPADSLILVGRSIRADLADLRNFGLVLALVSAAIFAIGMIGAWLLARISVRPIAVISRAAAEISEENLQRRIDVNEMDAEFAGLAGTLNETFDRIETAFAQQMQFTADASHELRTPLAVIQLHQELALSQPRSAESYRETIETCQLSAQRMNVLAESLLTLARLDARSAQPKWMVIDLADCVAAAVGLAGELAETKQIEIDFTPLSIRVQGDPEQLGQVFSNLLSNAIKFSPSHSRVNVTMVEQADKAVVSISDEGPGIAEANLPHIFERFYRVDEPRTRDAGGSGLGLAICQSIVRAHNGSVAVKSALGKGTAFSVSLPKASSEGGNKPIAKP